MLRGDESLSMRIFFCHCVNEAEHGAAFLCGKACEFLQERDVFRVHLNGAFRPRSAVFKSFRKEFHAHVEGARQLYRLVDFRQRAFCLEIAIYRVNADSRGIRQSLCRDVLAKHRFLEIFRKMHGSSIGKFHYFPIWTSNYFGKLL